jgi:hypothetical protein
MRSSPEAGAVKQSVLWCEEMFEPSYLNGESSESKTGFTSYRHQVSGALAKSQGRAQSPALKYLTC